MISPEHAQLTLRVLYGIRYPLCLQQSLLYVAAWLLLPLHQVRNFSLEAPHPQLTDHVIEVGLNLRLSFRYKLLTRLGL